MPSPLMHIAAGVGMAHLILGRSAWLAANWRFLLVCVFLSIAPDLDAIPGIAFGRMAEYHNNMSHSPAFGAMVCLVLLPVTKRMLTGWRTTDVFVLSWGCYGLHVALDWMTFGRGVMLAWPLSSERFRAPFELFRGVRWSEGLLTSAHWPTLANELAVIAFVTLFCVLASRYRTSTSASRK